MGVSPNTTHNQIPREGAEEYTAALGQVFSGGWRLIHHAHRQGIPRALGMSTEDWVRERLGGYVRLAIPERRDAVAELDAEGLTGPEIAGVLGVSDQTIYRDIGRYSTNVEPAPRIDERFGQSDSTNVEPDDAAWDDEGDDGTEDCEDEPELWPHPSGVGMTTEPPPSSLTPHIAHNSGDHEWYTPREYITAATSVLGAIDLDPASSSAANEIIKATRFYTADDDGLRQPWAGRVWMNPPYAQPAVDRFCTRLAREYAEGTVTAAIVLVNNATETTWFQEMAAQCGALCFPRGRVKFWHPHKESAPLQGQAVLYLGRDAEAFRAAFVRFGFVAGRSDAI